jgi:hypothetical protein
MIQLFRPVSCEFVDRRCGIGGTIHQMTRIDTKRLNVFLRASAPWRLKSFRVFSNGWRLLELKSSGYLLEANEPHSN